MGVICGIDEAGRGPVVGPLVVCGVCATPDDDTILIEMGVADSKTLSPAKREEIYKKLVTRFRYHIAVFSASDIDDAMDNGVNLNSIEARGSAQILKALTPNAVILDCPSTNPPNYVREIRKLSGALYPIAAEYKADVNYPVVSAASIIAKVERDHRIEQLKKEVGLDFGSGYPSDPTTQQFLRDHWKSHGFLFRKNWKTYQAATQRRLGDF